MNILTSEFPEVMKQFTIGKSYEGRNISAFLLGLNLTSKNLIAVSEKYPNLKAYKNYSKLIRKDIK